MNGPGYSREDLVRFWKGEDGEAPLPPSTRYPLEPWERRVRERLLGRAEIARRARMAVACRLWYARNRERERRRARERYQERRTAWSG